MVIVGAHIFRSAVPQNLFDVFEKWKVYVFLDEDSEKTDRIELILEISAWRFAIPR